MKCPIYTRPRWQFERCYAHCSERIDIWKVLSNQRGVCNGNGNGGQPLQVHAEITLHSDEGGFFSCFWDGDRFHAGAYGKKLWNYDLLTNTWKFFDRDTESWYRIFKHNGLIYAVAENIEGRGHLYRFEDWNLVDVHQGDWYGRKLYSHGGCSCAGKAYVVDNDFEHTDVYSHIYASASGDPGTFTFLARTQDFPYYRSKTIIPHKGSPYLVAYLRDMGSGGKIIRIEGNTLRQVGNDLQWGLEGGRAIDGRLWIGNFQGGPVISFNGSNWQAEADLGFETIKDYVGAWGKVIAGGRKGGKPALAVKEGGKWRDLLSLDSPGEVRALSFNGTELLVAVGRGEGCHLYLVRKI